MNQNSGPISLFVVHWNQPDECIATVRRLLGQQVELRVVIVDNASKPEAYQLLRTKLDRNIEIVRLEENKGWGPALNIALAKWLQSDQSPYCLISAHDAEPAEDCIKLLVRAMEDDPRVAIVCPQYPDTTMPRFSCLRGVCQDRGVPLASGTSELVDVPHGTLMLLRRESLAEIGLFDERYFAYGDEHELGMRARRRGWKIALVWGAIVANRGTWTPSPWRSYLFTRNSLLLVHDYRGKLCAWTRAALILVNTVWFLIVPPPKGFAFSPKARWRGVLDYFAARFGRPTLANE
jgi:N-acetylglucosaminyl-diphospho-decaprenol L-rhamnosyltransferase